MPGRSFYDQKRPTAKRPSSSPSLAAAKRNRVTIPSPLPGAIPYQRRLSTGGDATRPRTASSLPHCSRLVTPVLPDDHYRAESVPTSQYDAFDADTDDSLNEVVLALDVRGRRDGSSTLGACWFVAREERLFFLEDMRGGAMDAVEAVKQQAQPTHILLPSRVDEAVDQILNPRQDRAEGPEVEGASMNLPYQLDFRPSSEFAYDAALRRLVDLQLPGSGTAAQLSVPGDANQSSQPSVEPGFTSRQGCLLRLSAFVDLESRMSVGCAGALLAYLSRRRALLHLPGDRWAEQTLAVSVIESVALQGHMMLNADTIAALQVVRTESHPSLQNHGPSNSGAKEDLSLYGVFKHLAKTPQGKTLLRLWFLRPSTDLAVIEERHATVSAFMQSSNQALMEDMVNSLKSVKNMRAAVVHLRKGTSYGASARGGSTTSGIKNGVWYSLRSFAFHALGIRAAVAQMTVSRSLAVLSKVLSLFEAHSLATLGRLVTEIVDFPTSLEQRRTAVKPGVDSELDELRRTYDGLEDLLSHASREIAATVPAALGVELSVVFFPQIGFLVCLPKVPATGRAAWEGTPAEQWQLFFTTEGCAYYKDYRTRDLDGTLGDVWARVCGKEIEIVHALAQRVLLCEDVLVAVSDVCAELDAILALAQGARLYNLARPRMTEENALDIKEGRHLLQELSQGMCIPNDTRLAGGRPDESPRGPRQDTTDGALMPPPPRPSSRHFNPYASSSASPAPSVLILTGPNYSGKSLHLKSIASTVLLAHIGSFVPCLGASVGLVDAILTRVATRESVARPHSAFALDLRQVAAALRLATRRSLVLLDELGKGTLPTDGAGICAGVVAHLARRAEGERPMCLLATHFEEIFDLGWFGHGVGHGIGAGGLQGVGFARMDVRIGNGQGDRTANSVAGNTSSGTVQEILPAAEQVTYLYAVRPGRSRQSLATACAALSGVDAAVVARAEDLLRIEQAGGDLVAACVGSAGLTTGESEGRDGGERARAERVAREFLAQDLAQDLHQDECQWRAWLEGLV